MLAYTGAVAVLVVIGVCVLAILIAKNVGKN